MSKPSPSKQEFLVNAFVAAWCAVVSGVQASGEPNQKPNPWESAIAEMEASDKKSPPPTGGVVFVGSSSILFWDLDKWFPKLDAVNRGFGGSEIADSIHFAERIILPHAPRTVVVYAGDNDIAGGKSPATVFEDYKTLVRRIHGDLPKARIVFIAIKPSIARWKLVEKMRFANAMIREFCDEDPRLVFLDVDTPMIGEDGKPREELFQKDGLHLNSKGYALWAKLLLPHLADVAPLSGGDDSTR